MKVLVACEFSGIVRDAFIAAGHEAVSCDLQESLSEGPHIVGDALEFLDNGWDLLIAHPPCTYLCNSGVRWLYKDGKGPVKDPERWSALLESVKFFKQFLASSAPRVCVENPKPHRYAKLLIGPWSQCIQPWQFGCPEQKATCLWLKGLEPLKPTKVVYTRWNTTQTMPEREGRSMVRSLTFPGIAAAMAEQWGTA